AITGERQGYYCDFGSLAALAKTYTRVFFHDGIWSAFRGRTHGRQVDVFRVPAHRFLGYLQDHDQIGNRAIGGRIAASLSPELIALRRARPELTDPRLDRVHADFDEDARWLLVRRGRLRIAANLGAKAVRLPLGQRGTGVLAASSPGVTIKQDMVTMPPATFAVIETRAPSPGLSRQRGERGS